MVTRLNGFSNTGIDIDTTVQKLMQAAQIPMNKLNQKKQTLQWQRDDYRSMNAKMFDFRSTLSSMKLQSTYLARKATSSDETAITATATVSANQGINTIEISKLATAAQVTSGALGAGVDTTALSALGLAGTTSLSIGGDKGTATIELKTTDTIAGLVNAVNTKSNFTGVKVSYDSNMDRLFFTSSTTGTASNIKLRMKSTDESVVAGQNLLQDVLKIATATAKKDAGQSIVGTKVFASSSELIDSAATVDQTLQISVSGTVTPYTFTLNNKTTIGKLIDNINNSDLGKTGVSAYLDSNGKLAIFNPDNTKTIGFADTTVDASDELTNLGLTAAPVLVAPDDAIDYSEASSTGLNSIVIFNGVTTGFATNTFSINGISFSAKKEAVGVSKTITVSQDTDSMYNSIKAFVDKYNDLISTVKTKMDEKAYRDFLPLTDEQKKDMKDDDIKRWEEKSKSGLLHNDPLLTSGLLNFRTGLNSTVDGQPVGAFKSLSEIGISTTLVAGKSISGSFLEQGKLYIDDAALRKALDEKPDEVMNLFIAKDGDTTSDSADGIAVRLYDRTTVLMNKLTKKAGATGSIDSSFLMGKTLLTLNKDIDKQTLKLDALQTRYYNQFTAMEKYINQMNMQSAQLANFGK
ncbi:MAG: flagellar filament capping protein FliD [Paenibacillaceae bacterium]